MHTAGTQEQAGEQLRERVESARRVAALVVEVLPEGKSVPWNQPTTKQAKRQKREPVPRGQLPPEIWHEEHAADFLGLSVSTIHKLAVRGALPCSRPAGRLFCDPDKVEAGRRARRSRTQPMQPAESRVDAYPPLATP